MKSVLSIVAKSSTGDSAIGQDSSDGNIAISRIADMMNKVTGTESQSLTSLQTQTQRYQTQVERATYVRDIANILRNLKTPPDIIQIIGHGSAGRLELGSYWTQSPLDIRLGPAVLDSNPDSYGMLIDAIPSSSKVFLLGCSVGSTAPSGYVASGRALLFDLEDLSGADIYAADDLVYPELFQDNFLYNGSLVTSNGKPANPAALVSPPVQSQMSVPTKNTNVADTPAIPAVPNLTTLLSAPAFGLRKQFEAAVPPTADFFKNYVLAEPPPGPLLAMSELVFAASNYKRVEAICCLRYLRAMTEDGRTLYFKPSPPSPPPQGNAPTTSGSPGTNHFPSAKPTLDNLRSGALDVSRNSAL